MRERMNYRSVGLAIMLLALIGSVQAAEIYQNLLMPSGTNWNTPSAGYWAPDTPNTAGNNYWVGTMPDGITKPPGLTYGQRAECRTPDAAAATFSGDMLTISTSGTLYLKNNSTTAVTIPNLRAVGSTPRIYVGTGGILELAGVLNNQANLNSYLNIQVTDTSSPQRHLKLTAKLTGPGHIRIEGRNFVTGDDHALELNNDTNDFTGRIYTYRDGKLIVNAPGALGNSSGILIDSPGQFIANSVVTAPTVRLYVSTGGTLNLTQNATFGEFYIDDTKVPSGTYTMAALTAAYPATATFTGAGSLTVAGIAQAANIYLAQNMGSGNWNTAGNGFWSPDTPNLLGSTYYIGTMTDGVTRPPAMGYNARFICRTPDATTAAETFNGDKMMIGTSGTLYVRSASGFPVIVPDLRTFGTAPRIDANVDGLLKLDGVITNNAADTPGVVGFTQFQITGGKYRHIDLMAKLTGPGMVRLEGANAAIGTNDHALELNNNTNTFTGPINLVRDGKLIVNQPNALGGNTTITLNDMSQFRNNVVLNRATTNLNLQSGSITSVGANMTFRSIRIPGGQIHKGTYLASALAASNPGLIVDGSGGTASVTVGTGLPQMEATLNGNIVTSITFVDYNVEGAALTKVVKVTNVGDTPLTFSNWIGGGSTTQGIEMDVNSNHMYTVVSAVPATNAPLAAGAFTNITVRMSGTLADYIVGNANTSTGTLNIYTDSLGVASTLSIPIYGNTVPVELSNFSAK